MRRGKQIFHMLLIAVILCVSVLPMIPAEAGISETVIDSNMLDGINWSNPNEDVVIEEGKILFTENGTEYSRYISRAVARIDANFEELVKLSASVNFQSIPKGKAFIVALGLSNIEAVSGEAGNVEVAFSNNGGIKVGVTAYDENGTAVQVVSPKACNVSMKRAVNVTVEISTSSKIKVVINGNTVCSGILPVSGEGRVGFMQTGVCNVEIANLSFTHYGYERPENTNIDTDFEKGALDISVLNAKALEFATSFPRGQFIEEYNGSQVFAFKNIHYSYIGTNYKYSNFEISFDVPYVKTKAVYNEDGSVKEPGQSSIAIAFGAAQSKTEAVDEWIKAGETVFFHKDRVYSYNNREEWTVDLTEDYFETENRGFSVKLKVVDGLVEAGIKWMDEKDFHTVLTYKMKSALPTGFVQIWATSAGQFALDNLKITNLDENPNLIETEFKSGKWDVPEDAGYQPLERVYASTDADGKALAFSWYYLIPITVVVVLVGLAVTMLATRKKGNKTKEATADETEITGV